MGVRRGGRWLLRPAAFGIAGGVTGLAGPPGTGKSTLLATFATLRRPQVGALRILGRDTANCADLRAARARIGYLPGRFHWADNLTAAEFVAYAAYYKGMRGTAVRPALRRFDIADTAATELALLPPDVRLRAGLAATCVHEPELVLLDDPLGVASARRGAPARGPSSRRGGGAHARTGADARFPYGDPADQADLADLAELMPLLHSLAPTVVITAPAPQLLTGWCDRLLALSRGRITDLPTRSPRRVPGSGVGGAPAPVDASPAPRPQTPRDRVQRLALRTGAGV
ncbi:ATP-binding cassette domain-containing protein [Actinomadura sp. NBRC 104425]|uniref:ATP-binding cassette domain-containing protein n=1 Tax=Actinomadura sp. NBRC 104425 TaxID=3032204 RepID=UPI0025521A84|nr:ATP-binding cassette domain-containing protein [Actinomadura sp. NBRC 104425]